MKRKLKKARPVPKIPRLLLGGIAACALWGGVYALYSLIAGGDTKLVFLSGVFILIALGIAAYTVTKVAQIYALDMFSSVNSNRRPVSFSRSYGGVLLSIVCAAAGMVLFYFIASLSGGYLITNFGTLVVLLFSQVGFAQIMSLLLLILWVLLASAAVLKTYLLSVIIGATNSKNQSFATSMAYLVLSVVKLVLLLAIVYFVLPSDGILSVSENTLLSFLGAVNVLNIVCLGFTHILKKQIIKNS